MAIEREAVRERSESADTPDFYAAGVAAIEARNKRSREGTIVIKGSSLPWKQSRQGYSKHYIRDFFREDVALQDWRVFVQNIRTKSGRHVHQGGICLHVLEGKGRTTCNGETIEWKAGDLVVLPVLPGGVEHQHFNDAGEEGSKWLATIFLPFWWALATEERQTEVHPDFADEK